MPGEKRKIHLSDAKCKSMELLTPVQFARQPAADGTPAGDTSGNTFLMEAYTGELVERWWGMLIVDLAGIQAADNMPIFRDHIRSKIVGYSDKAWLDGSFFVEGRFSGVTDDAREVKGLAGEGFPWQASIGVEPLSILELAPGAMTEINGREVFGPAEIWLTSKVFETSFVPFGADDQTSVCTFSKFNEVAQGESSARAEYKPEKGRNIMITLEKLEKDAPELLAQIRKDARNQGMIDGAATELARIQGVKAQAMLGHESLIETLMFDGKTTGPEAAVQILAAERQVRDTALAQFQKGGANPVAAAIAPEMETLSQDLEKDGVEFDEDQARAKFAATAALKAEFGSCDTYLAYLQATKKGKVKILSHK